MDLHTLAASVFSSIASRIVTYPIDTIAVRRQTGRQIPLNLGSPRELYRGLGASIVLTTPAVSLYLCVYRATKEHLQPDWGECTKLYVVSGTVAECAASGLFTPMEVVKARMQVAESNALLPVLRSLYAAEGARGFYRGYWIGLGMFVPYNAVWWSTYEHGKAYVRDLTGRSDVATQAACSGAAATLVAASLLHPLDVIKTTFQVGKETSLVAVAKQVVRQRKVYAGLGMRLMCSVPGSVIGMAAFELLKPDDNLKDMTKDHDTTPLATANLER